MVSYFENSDFKISKKVNEWITNVIVANKKENSTSDIMKQ